MNNVNKTISPGLVIACLYIFFSYIAQGSILNQNFIRVFLYLFIAWAVFEALKRKNIIITPYTNWYFCFIFLCIFSFVYSVYIEYSVSVLYELIVIFIVTLAFSIVLKEEADFSILFWAYSLSATILFIILFLSGKLYTEERLGTSLMGNANIFATMFMISAICSVWLTLNQTGFYKVIAFTSLLAQLFALALSGGRKYILLPFLFLYFVLLLKQDAKGKQHIFKYTIIAILISLLLYWLLFNIPVLYNSVGHRIESLLNMFRGSGYVDNSSIIRRDMILYGIDMWLSKPLIGYGINSYMGLFGMKTGIFLYAHNNLIEMLVDLGFIGFMVYYTYYVWIFLKLLKIKICSSIKNFFLSFILCLIVFEIGGITYNVIIIQVFLSLPAVFYSINRRRKIINER